MYRGVCAILTVECRHRRDPLYLLRVLVSLLGVNLPAFFAHDNTTFASYVLDNVYHRLFIERLVEVHHLVDDRSFGKIVRCGPLVEQVQYWLEPDGTSGLVNDGITPFQGAVDVLEGTAFPRVDRIDVPQAERECAALWQELWVLKQPLERF